MNTIIDSHVHLDASVLDADRSAVLKRAAEAGVSTMIIPATTTASWAPIARLCDSGNGLHPAYGLHPMFLEQHAPEHVDALSSWLDQHFAVAIGEIGLDFHEDDAQEDVQRDYFTRQLKLAREREIPVIVHARKALEEVTLTLRRTDGLSGVVHSFSGSQQQAEHLWNLGFFLGIGGPVTYPRAKRLRRIVTNMPLEFLLLESDAPDQPNVGHRGQRNEPALVLEVLQCIATLREESEAEIAAATSANARRLFKLPRQTGGEDDSRSLA